MNPVTGALVLIGAIAYALWSRRRAEARAVVDTPDEVAGSSEFTVPIDAAGFPAGGASSAATTAAEHKRQDDERTGNLQNLGGAIGGAIGGPGGAIYGAALGRVLGDQWAGFTNLGEKTGLELLGAKAQLGIPFTPHTADGDKIALALPVEGGSHEAVTLKIPRASLVGIFPGTGAVEACERSGMFQWRPRDQATPFSEVLYKAAPWLAAYEHYYVFGAASDQPDDFTGPDGRAYRWQDLHHMYWRGEPKDFALAVLAMRRAWAFAARGGNVLAASWAIYLYNLSLRWNDFSWQADAGGGLMLGGEPTDKRKMILVWQTLFEIASECGGGIGYDADTREKIGFVPVNDSKRPKIFSGFPGAWRTVDLEPEDRAPTVPATTVSKVLGGSVSKVSTNLVAATLPKQPSDVAAAFAFEVWLPYVNTRPAGAAKVEQIPWHVRSSRFADLFGSHAATRVELEAGKLAWGSPGMRPDVAARWRYLYPGLG